MAREIGIGGGELVPELELRRRRRSWRRSSRRRCAPVLAGAAISPIVRREFPAQSKRHAMAAKGAKGKVKKVVLAYSGGLDTSIILKWLQETYGCEVVTFTADLGQGEELEPARAQGRDARHQAGATSSSRTCARSSSATTCSRCSAPTPLYEGVYLLGTSIARPLIAKKQIEIAAQDRRRRRLPRRHRQGQRPGALRAHLLRARALDQDHRAVARVGLQEPRGADRLRREAPDPGRQGQARRGAVLGRRQPAALLLRGQGAGGPGRSSRRPTSTSAPSRRWRRPTRRPTSRSASPRAMR